jgi:cell pole-organizing protein PopZ
MSRQNAAEEPSMEEILASIRRIISDEGEEQAGEETAEPEESSSEEDELDTLFEETEEDQTEAEPLEDEEVLDLTDELKVEDEPQEEELFEPEMDLEFSDFQEPEPEPEFSEISDDTSFIPEIEEPQEELPPLDDAAQLLSKEAGSHVQQAFGELATTILSNNARTLEDLVKEMLRPMLKAWLDDNLPPMVERLVRAEIERVSRGVPKR